MLPGPYKDPTERLAALVLILCLVLAIATPAKVWL